MLRTAAALLLAVALPASAVAQQPQTAAQQQVVDRATVTINEMRTDPTFGYGRELLGKAKAVMVVPELLKAGFFFGGEGGTGLLLARRADGSWSDPAFYIVGAASFGLQIGVETAEVVFFVMSEKALRAWMEDEVKLGTKAGLTVLTIGSNAEAAATTNADIDVVAWSRTKGAFAGLTLEGSLIKPRHEWNETYYGRPVKPEAIVFSEGVGHARTIALRDALKAP
jgi:lipid-binding SYLF domain-containing protein